MSNVVELRESVAEKSSLERHPGVVERREVVLPADELPLGGPLMAALMHAAHERGHTTAELAEALDVTYGYIAQLRSGTRSSANVSDAFAARCARYLGIPRLTVLMLAGRVTSEDFFDENALNYTSLARAYMYIRNDPIWGPRAPALSEEEVSRSGELVLLAVWLYEDATGTTLLPGMSDPKHFARAVEAHRHATKKKPPR